MQNKFFGSKLNSILLLVLIILMIVALFVMFKDKGKYFFSLDKNSDLNLINNTDGGVGEVDFWKIFDNQKIWPVKFKYPQNWEIVSKQIELHPGSEKFIIYCVTKIDCDSIDAIFLGEPQEIGSYNPVNYYIIMKATNDTGPYSISWNASSEAKNVFRLLVGTSGY